MLYRVGSHWPLLAGGCPVEPDQDAAALPMPADTTATVTAPMANMLHEGVGRTIPGGVMARNHARYQTGWYHQRLVGLIGTGLAAGRGRYASPLAVMFVAALSITWGSWLLQWWRIPG